MKSELLLASLCATLLFSTFLVAADTIQNPFGATITIGSPGSTTTTTSTTSVTVNNPANITFQVIARDDTGQSQDVNISLYDGTNHNFLNSSRFVGLGNLFSPTSDADFELAYDNQNLDVMVNGLNVTNFGNSLASITIETSNPQISNFTLYRAYHVELPWNTTNFNSITLKINLAGLNVNYSSLVVYRCGNYNIITNVCSDSGGWQPQTISVDQTNKFVTLNINHFSVYAVGSSTSQVSQTTSSTSSATSQTTTSTSSTYTAQVSDNNPAPSSSSGGGSGGAAFIPPVTTTTSSTPSTTTTLLIVRGNTSSSSSATTETAPISGFLGLTSVANPYVIAAVVIVISAVAVAWLRSTSPFPSLPFGKTSSHGTYKTYGKGKKRKTKSTELQLSL